jgi:hypothetical protein
MELQTIQIYVKQHRQYVVKEIPFYNIKMQNIIKLEILPEDVINYIKKFIPLDILVWLNRENYTNYHHTAIYKYIPPLMCENYIRMVIRKDKDYVFKILLNDNIMRWYSMKKYMYKNMTFENYLYFLVAYATENNSRKIKSLIEDTCYLILGKKWHKKTKVLFNRWKN